MKEMETVMGVERQEGKRLQERVEADREILQERVVQQQVEMSSISS